jgi:two-component system phosphate regulon sensor histidine kinase PhoR
MLIRARNSIRWRIAIPYMLLILAAVASLSLYAARLLRQTAIAQEKEQLLLEATMVRQGLVAPLESGDLAQLATVAKQYAGLLGARVTIVAPNGEVLAESDNDPDGMRNHLFRPEIQQALAGGQGSAVRASDTLGVDMIYAAVRVDAGGRPLGFVRVALPQRDLTRQLEGLGRALLLVALTAGAVALLLAIGIAESVTRPIRQLTVAVHRLVRGELDQHLVRSTSDEVGQLTSDTMEMANQLRQTIEDLNAERGRLEAVLDNMADAVIITDSQGLVSLINPAAQRLTHTGKSGALGRSFAQVVRQHEVTSVWRACVDSGEQHLEVMDLGDDLMQVVATPLSSIEPGACLVVLQDVGQVRRLEGMRREFVSNISHELRTPLASMRAIADTLRDGALDDPPAAARFLSRMDGQIDSLTQMVEELLELSRIESGQVPIRLERVAVDRFVVPAVERLLPQAERSQLDLAVDIPGSLPLVLGDVQRLQQVVTNLVHNAIKFTAAGGSIRVHADWASERVVVSVTDTGIGIPSELQPRIFERFFKADRSRSTGGTGLGLAIAKHIVQAHGGRIWFESEEGQGSRFHFSLLSADKRPD